MIIQLSERRSFSVRLRNVQWQYDNRNKNSNWWCSIFISNCQPRCIYSHTPWWCSLWDSGRHSSLAYPGVGNDGPLVLPLGSCYEPAHRHLTKDNVNLSDLYWCLTWLWILLLIQVRSRESRSEVSSIGSDMHHSIISITKNKK